MTYVIDYLPDEKVYVCFLEDEILSEADMRFPNLAIAQCAVGNSGNKYRLSPRGDRMAREAAGIEVEAEIDWESGDFCLICPQCDDRMRGDVGSSIKCSCGLTWRVEVKAVGKREEGP